MNSRIRLSAVPLVVTSLVGLNGFTAGCNGHLEPTTPELEGGRPDAESATPESGATDASGPETLDSGRADSGTSGEYGSGIEGGAGGQCVGIGGACPLTVSILADGGYVYEQPACCGSAVCVSIPCCHSACMSVCVAPTDACCSSGSPCGSDAQCCSKTCLHADAAIVPPNLPGGSCM